MKLAKQCSKSEFEIQAEAVSLLKEALGTSYIIKAEWTANKCRFDIAVFVASTRDLVCTVEIKRRGNKKHQKQLNKYFWATGKPCVLLTEHTMHKAIAAVAAFCGKRTIA